MFSSTCGHRLHHAEALEASLLLDTIQGTEHSQLRQRAALNCQANTNSQPVIWHGWMRHTGSQRKQKIKQ